MDSCHGIKGSAILRTTCYDERRRVHDMRIWDAEGKRGWGREDTRIWWWMREERAARTNETMARETLSRDSAVSLADNSPTLWLPAVTAIDHRSRKQSTTYISCIVEPTMFFGGNYHAELEYLMLNRSEDLWALKSYATMAERDVRSYHHYNKPQSQIRKLCIQIFWKEACLLHMLATSRDKSVPELQCTSPPPCIRCTGRNFDPVFFLIFF